MKRSILALIIIIGILSIIFSYKELTHSNKGESIFGGDYNNGSLHDGYLLPYDGANYKCHSLISYYILDREYVNSKLYRTVIQTYEELDKHYDRDFIYMEAAGKNGGRIYPHRTHQNGLSIDFMAPLVRNGKPRYFNSLGILRYALDFDEKGRYKHNKAVQIDFNIMAHHILILEEKARENGLKIKKVILNTSLKDDLFTTDYGRKLKASGIYFARNLTPRLNRLHDDHFHVDFELLNNN